MSKYSNDNLKTVKKIFDEAFFRIPLYQRGYAWTSDELQDFWNDITDLMNSEDERIHYMSQLTLEKINAYEPDIKEFIPKDYDGFYVVDGQQRLTTIIILISQILRFQQEQYKTNEIFATGENLSDLEDNTKQYIMINGRVKENTYGKQLYILGYDTESESQKCLQNRIFNNDTQYNYTKSIYTKNLENAATFFKKRINEYYQGDLKRIDNLLDTIQGRLSFNLYYITDSNDTLVAFETLNNRGKKLTTLEMLKSRLMYIAIKNNVYSKDVLVASINASWTEIYRCLGQNPNLSISEDSFLTDHWHIYFKYSYYDKGDRDRRRQITNAEDSLLKYWFCQNGVIPDNGFEQELVEDDVTDYQDDYSAEIDETETTLADIDLHKNDLYKFVNEYTESLSVFSTYYYYSYYTSDRFEGCKKPDLGKDVLIWLDKLNRLGVESFRPLITTVLMNRTVNESAKIEFLKALERYIFITFRILATNARSKRSTFYILARNFNRDSTKCTLESIIEQLKDLTNESARGVYGKFNEAVQMWYKKNNYLGFFSWSSLKYFLYEYEYELCKKEGRLPQLKWWSDEQREKTNIEHILPEFIFNNYDKSDRWNSYWRKHYEGYSGAPDNLKRLVHNLGNLVALQHGINSSMQDHGIDDTEMNGKICEGKIHKLNKGSLPELEIIRDFLPFTAESIKKRGLKLLAFMEERWDIRLGNEEEKIKLLGLEFLDE
jgi:hypothetical protein